MFYQLYPLPPGHGDDPGVGLPDFDEHARFDHAMPGEQVESPAWDADHAAAVATDWAESCFDEEHPEQGEWYSVLVWPVGLPEVAYAVHLHRPVAYTVSLIQPVPLGAGWDFSAPRPGEAWPSWLDPDPGDSQETHQQHAWELLAARGALCLTLAGWLKRRQAQTAERSTAR